ncbi:transporter substrate-binding domain-containing protein [Azospirillum picis]|uniref:Octopine/nopaline transport system substrate-binding protein n=1 Tax=Azospirillum picis TaxID=488438 RepID=A0ABU0MS01_9PROT|nr:transporter substrate-binding domain-containing protein [Azospirillum picis]MBP2302495.1 octopine/nopaline transport system substrate-binding protein [Azospirillum picis]MDQ0536263.1 octopine/nopaline transport system substrate-binding protein [Azospirillum picis]
MLRRLVLAASVASAILSAVASPAQPAKLVIATEGAFAPWNSIASDGALVGFEIDLGRELCRRMEASCEFVAVDWDGILPGLQQGRYDAVMAGVTVTADRAQAVDFSAPYAADPATFAVRAGTPLPSLLPSLGGIDLSAPSRAATDALGSIRKALEGKTVAVQTSTIHARLMSETWPGVEVRTYDTLDHAALDLAAGRVDALLGARTVVEAMVKAGADITAAGPTLTGGVLGSGIGVATRKGEELSARFSHAIDAAAEDGVTADLSRRWFGFDVSAR